MINNREITSFRFGHIRNQLTEPYKLSFKTLEYIDSVWVVIEFEDGTLGIGEAVPLPGYGKEGINDVLKIIGHLANDFKSIIELQRRCAELEMHHPFAVSAVMTALDLPLWCAKIESINPIPLIMPLASNKDDELVISTFENGLENGYKNYKMKIGENLIEDIQCTKSLLRLFPSENYKISFDANQGYSLDEASAFCDFLDSEGSSNVLWLEQPLRSSCYDEMGLLMRNTKVRMILDESIYNDEDLLRAKDIGCCGIKLKLCKHFGMERTYLLAKRAKGLGLKVIIGNGVATDIENLGEALIFSFESALFEESAECNGFLKIDEPVVFPQLKLDDNGQLVWQGDRENLEDQIFKQIKNFVGQCMPIRD